MKLYTSPGACSLSCHISFEESRLPVEYVIPTDQNPAAWAEIQKLNPRAKVPVLMLDDGTVLTENIAIHTFVAEKAPQSGLLPAVGTVERAQAYRWLSWVASELHPAFGGLFNPDITASERQEIISSELDPLLKEADAHLAGKTFLVGDRFSAADAYLFTVYGWAAHLKVPTGAYKNLNAYSGRIFERPAVQAAMKAEGLLGGKA